MIVPTARDVIRAPVSRSNATQAMTALPAPNASLVDAWANFSAATAQTAHQCHPMSNASKASVRCPAAALPIEIVALGSPVLPERASPIFSLGFVTLMGIARTVSDANFSSVFPLAVATMITTAHWDNVVSMMSVLMLP